ncbi:MAG: PrsW family intramembrane metalloprotease [Chloroflexota bacterium]|nr:MAG: PrsW family intramembrane metalloprotease [Chloroflexota bacterium]
MKLLASSGNPNFAPTVILLGAFVVPVTYVIYLYEVDALHDVPVLTLALTFFYGGVLGIIAAQLLEQRLVLNSGLIGMLGVGISEEIAKPLGVLWLARRRDFISARHGFLVGAAAGMGFAAFETMGYGFTFLIASRGNLGVLDEVLLTRGLLSPMAHAAWTALVVGVLWRERRVNRAVLGAFATAVILHALWDWTAGLLPISVQLPGLELRWRFVDLAFPALSLPVPGLVIGLFGLWVVRRASRASTTVASIG